MGTASGSRPDMERLLIVAATRREMRAALDGLSCPEDLPHGQPLEWSHGGRRALLLVTGIGPINAAMRLSLALAGAGKVSGVLNLGIGGSFDLERLPLLEVCTVVEEIWPEFGLWTETGLKPRALKFPLGKHQGQTVWDRIALEPDRAAWQTGLKLSPGWPAVTSLTVAGVTGTAQRAQVLQQGYGALLENMEGFALGWVCLQSSVPFLECRSVSNLVGSRDAGDWNLQGAMKALGQILPALFQVEPHQAR